VAKLAAAARSGIVHGVDYSAASVAAAKRTNRELVELGRVVIQQASASDLPFADDTFDLVTAVETHFWWRELDAGMREALRVLKPGGRMVVIAEFYNGGRHARYADRLGKWTTMAVLDVDQHRAMLRDAGFVDVQIDEEVSRGWICCVAAKGE
jgi:ubiquinone/menaquinone biosynthesis C-methylase UbiE